MSSTRVMPFFERLFRFKTVRYALALLTQIHPSVNKVNADITAAFRLHIIRCKLEQVRTAVKLQAHKCFHCQRCRCPGWPHSAFLSLRWVTVLICRSHSVFRSLSKFHALCKKRQHDSQTRNATVTIDWPYLQEVMFCSGIIFIHFPLRLQILQIMLYIIYQKDLFW